MATDVLEDTPELIERAVGEALTARSISIDSFTGLGPEDLCCLTKVTPCRPHCAAPSPGLCVRALVPCACRHPRR